MIVVPFYKSLAVSSLNKWCIASIFVKPNLIAASPKKYLLEKSNLQQKPETDQWFDLTELCEYLPDKPAKATVYAHVSANAIPCHKGAKKLRFLKSEIDVWLKQGKKKTVSEIEKQTDTFLSTVKKKGGGHA